MKFITTKHSFEDTKKVRDHFGYENLMKWADKYTSDNDISVFLRLDCKDKKPDLFSPENNIPITDRHIVVRVSSVLDSLEIMKP